MVNQSILDGLKRAKAKGEPLRRAMMSFYNAGYPKEEIEEAARILQREQLEQRRLTDTGQIQEGRQKVQEKTNIPLQSRKTTQRISNYGAAEKELSQKIELQTEKSAPQKLSNYEQPKRNNKFIIFLIILLFILIAGAVLFIFFKDQILNFFNRLF